MRHIDKPIKRDLLTHQLKFILNYLPAFSNKDNTAKIFKALGLDFEDNKIDLNLDSNKIKANKALDIRPCNRDWCGGIVVDDSSHCTAGHLQ